MNTKFTIDFPLTPYENFIFDFAGVLFECEYIKFVRQAFPTANNHPELADTLFNSEIFLEYDKNLIDREALSTQLCQLVHCQPKDIDNLIDAFKEHLVPMQESISLLYALKKMNIKLYGLTNMPKDIYDNLIKKHEFLKIFEHITVSSYVQLAKPDPAIYQYLIAENKIDVARTIFIDDRPINLNPARQLGIKSVVFKNTNQLIQDLKNAVNAEVLIQNDTNN